MVDVESDLPPLPARTRDLPAYFRRYFPKNPPKPFRELGQDDDGNLKVHVPDPGSYALMCAHNSGWESCIELIESLILVERQEREDEDEDDEDGS